MMYSLGRTVGVWACLLVGLSCACVVPVASASEGHVLSRSFPVSTEPEYAQHELSDPQGLAVDLATGDVYVVDSKNDRVEEFGSSGEYIRAFGEKGTGKEKGECKEPRLTEPTEVAVDNSGGAGEGDVYVINGGEYKGENCIEVFNGEGKYISGIKRSEIEPVLIGYKDKKAEYFENLEGIAVDKNGNLWIEVFQFNKEDIEHSYSVVERPAVGEMKIAGEIARGNVDRGFAATPVGDLLIPYQGGANIFNAENIGPVGRWVGGNETPEPEGVADNPEHEGDIYIDRGTVVSRYSETPALIEKFGEGTLTGGVGTAVNDADDVYVADSSKDQVDEFGSVVEATVELESPEVKSTSTVLKGSVNPEGIPVTKCEFEYGKEKKEEKVIYTNAIPCSPSPGSGTSPVAVSAELTGLAPSTTYYYRLVATDEHGTQEKTSEVTTSKPVAAPSEVETLMAKEVTSTSAKLAGKLNPGGAAKYYFEYQEGTSACSGSCSKITPVEVSGDTQLEATATVTGLKADTKYRYRLVAENEAATVRAQEDAVNEEFETSPAAVAPSEVETLPAKDATTTGAELAGKLNPGGEAEYYFEYGEGECSKGGCTQKTSPVHVTGKAELEVVTTVAGLKSDTRYHARIVATNAAAKVDAASEGEFKTLVETKSPLTVAKYGHGTVTSGPTGIDCGVVCTYSFEGDVTLSETPEAGYEFAGWIGGDCKQLSESSCEVDVTEPREVGAVFLKAGTEGKEGKIGTEGPEGPEGFEGLPGLKGPAGPGGLAGPEGPAGTTGQTGPAGVPGADGAQGPAGPAGPAGQIELVTCKTVKHGGRKSLSCTTQLVSGPVKLTTTGTVTGTASQARALLSRHGAIYAAGIARAAVHGGHMSLRLAPLHHLGPGRYTLTLITEAGKHQTIHSEPFTLAVAEPPLR